MGNGSGVTDSRQHPRTPIRLKVSIKLSESGLIYAVTRDISEKGVFVLLDAESMPEIGAMVNVQVQGLPDGQEPPWVEMEVVRLAADGVGLMISEG